MGGVRTSISTTDPFKLMNPDMLLKPAHSTHAHTKFISPIAAISAAFHRPVILFGAFVGLRPLSLAGHIPCARPPIGQSEWRAPAHLPAADS